MAYIDREHQAAQYIIEDLAAKVERESGYKVLKTKDGYNVDVYVYNHGDYSCHVFVCKEPGVSVNSSNSGLYHLHGRDSYEVLVSDCKNMTREEVIRMFFK